MPYLGKEDHLDDFDAAEHVVLTLMNPYHKTGLNVTTDNFFTSMKTAKKLLEYDIKMIETLRSNKKEISRKLLHDSPKLPMHSSRFLFSIGDRIMIAFYKA